MQAFLLHSASQRIHEIEAPCSPLSWNKGVVVAYLNCTVKGWPG